MLNFGSGIYIFLYRDPYNHKPSFALLGRGFIPGLPRQQADDANPQRFGKIFHRCQGELGVVIKGSHISSHRDDISRFKFRSDWWDSRNPQKLTPQEVFSWNLVSSDEIQESFVAEKPRSWVIPDFFFRQIDSVGWIGWVHGLPIPWEDKLMQARERGITYNPKDTGRRCQLSELIARCTRNLYSLKKHILTYLYTDL